MTPSTLLISVWSLLLCIWSSLLYSAIHEFSSPFFIIYTSIGVFYSLFALYKNIRYRKFIVKL